MLDTNFGFPLECTQIPYNMCVSTYVSESPNLLHLGTGLHLTEKEKKHEKLTCSRTQAAPTYQEGTPWLVLGPYSRITPWLLLSNSQSRLV